MTKKVFFIVILFLLMVLAVSGCSRPDFSARTVVSPSGRYQIKVTINRDQADKSKYLCLRLHLLDSAGSDLFQLQTDASDRMKWAVGWLDGE